MVSIILLFVAGFCNGLMDRLQFHYPYNWNLNEQFWNPHYSWVNKYNNQMVGDGRRKWWILNIPVMFTDGWHLIKAIMLLCIGFGVVLYTPMFNIIIDFLIIRTAFGIGFNTIYRK